MLQEIERKFILDKLPKISELDWLETQNIYQIYIATGIEQIRARMQVRDRDNVNYTITVKRGYGLARDEIEIPISENSYDQIRTQSYELGKTRHTILVDDIKVYIDVYHEIKLIIAEVEFDNVQAAKQFQLPEWFGEEVTGEKEYENQYLWKLLNKKQTR
jgi:adenylate cyclase